MLARDAQRLLAGDEDAHLGRRAQQILGKLAHAAGQVLAVVQHEQQALVVQVIRQRLGQRAAGRLAYVQRVRDGLRDERLIRHRLQVDPPGAIGERGQQIGCDAEREARLAHPAGAGERDQAVGSQELADLLRLRSRPMKLVNWGGRLWRCGRGVAWHSRRRASLRSSRRA